jgi:integrase
VRYRERIPTARTKSQAKDAERDFIARLHNRNYGNLAESVLLKDFVRKVYVPYAEANKRNPKKDEYICQVICDYFKNKTFAQISPLLIEKFKRERKNSKTIYDTTRAAASVNRELEILSKVFTLAVDNNIIPSNPCRKVKKLRQDNQRSRYLSQDEETELTKALTGRRAYLKEIIILALNTGMRKGEILSLEWRNVDFSRNLIIVTNTKSGKDREIPMNSAVREALEGLSREGEKVFKIDWIKKAWASALIEAKIQNLRFHDLRHTAATRLADAGADAFTIASILGHATIQMSARYVKDTERKQRALEAIATRMDKVGHITDTQQKRRSA